MTVGRKQQKAGSKDRFSTDAATDAKARFGRKGDKSALLERIRSNLSPRPAEKIIEGLEQALRYARGDQTAAHRVHEFPTSPTTTQKGE